MSQLLHIPLDQITPDPNQPRTHFDEEKLAELAASIGEHGVLQPIEVSPLGDGRYMIHHGERRWRASQMAGLDAIPAIVARPIEDDARRLLLGVVENVQREDLNAIEEGRAYARLMELGMSMAEVARRMGKSLLLIKARMRWLELDERIQALVADGRLYKDGRIARALLDIPSPEARVKFASRAAGSGMSIKQFIAQCAKVAAAIREATADNGDGDEKSGVPILDVAMQAMNGAARPPDDSRYEWATVRTTASQMCQACSLRDHTKGVPEPAWALVRQIAGVTCQACDIEGDLLICKECPGVDLLQRLIVAAAQGAAAHV
ncbi:MAG: ParB/RepB/Spo0J family partition protein [Chloroflexi bacterium]|nr:ParB/RepB/Spo0J family partition protein [Chloroflexota bacterium]